MKTLIIDNYDSFTYNLVQYVGELGGNPIVYRNDAVTVDDIKELQPTHIILSPGPGHPMDSNYFGICQEIILELGKTTPLLGVCLGHQGVGGAFGAEVIAAPEILHGKRSQLVHFGDDIFQKVPSPFEAMRYHSLLLKRETLPESLEVIVETKKDKLIMGIKHKDFPIWGIQFHPESIGTPEGKQIIQNFLSI